MTKLMYYEFYKSFGRWKWLIVAALLLVKAVFTYNSLDVTADFSIPIYQEYIAQLSQMSQWQAEKFILNENERISSIIGAKADKENEYLSGKITLDEYKAYMKTYYEAESKSSAFGAIYQKYEQFQQIDEQSRVYFYDLEWYTFGKYLSLDFFIIFILMIFGIPVFCREHSCNTHRLNMVSRNGRRKLHSTKLVLFLIIGLMFGIAVYCLDFIVYGIRYGYANAQMPIQAVMSYSPYADNVSIQRLFVSMAIAKILWTVCLALMIAAVSALLKNNIISIIFCAVVLFLPMQILKLNGDTPNWLYNISIATGLMGRKENVDLIVPVINVIAWIMINIFIMTMLYPKRRK